MMVVFAVASRELVTSLMLTQNGMLMASIYVWQAFEQGLTDDGMAMGLVTLIVSGGLLALGAGWPEAFRSVIACRTGCR